MTIAGTLAAEAIQRSARHRLRHCCVPFLCYVDTKYVPLLGTTFSRQHMVVMHAQIMNEGTEPERDVHVRVSGLTTLTSAVHDPQSVITSIDGRPLTSFEEFEGSDHLDFVIRSLPVDGKYTMQIMGIAKGPTTLPTVSIRSETSVSTPLPHNPAWAAAVAANLRATLCHDEGEWVKVAER